MLVKLWQIADRLISLSATVGTIALALEVVVICADVVGRYFGAPLTGARDISQMAMIVLVFGGMALCDRLGGHIAVDIFESRFSPLVIRLGDIISPLVGAAIFLVIAWTLWQSAALSHLLNLSTNIIYLPKAWFQYIAVVMCVVTAIALLMRAAEAIISGRRPPHVRDIAI
jgi:TRAP-type C4-dicarboxylate transport system permease small subunit